MFPIPRVLHRTNRLPFSLTRNLIVQCFPLQFKRSFASGETLHVTADGDLYKFVLPLKNKGSGSGSVSSGNEDSRILFAVRGRDSVKDLVGYVHTEDPSAEVAVFSSNGYKVSGTSLIQDLVGDGFEIKIAGVPHKFPAVSKQHGKLSGFRGHIDANTIIEKENYSRVVRFLKDDTRSTIPLSEYLKICKEYDIMEPEALNLLRTLHHSGIVLNFYENSYLQDLVFVHPREISQKVLDALHIPETVCLEIDQQINEIREKFQPLEELKKQIEQRAVGTANRSLYLGFGFLIGQFGFLYHLVWFKLNWDVMEPVAYFIGLGSTIIAFVWYSRTRRDFGFIDLWDFVRNKSQKSLERKFNFDIDTYNKLKGEIEALEKQKERLHISSKLV